MPWLFSPTSASPLGFVRSSLFLFLYFLSSYSSSYYYLIQENLRDHRDKRGAKWDSKRKKREKSRKLKRKSLLFPLFKREKGKKVSKRELLTRFQYYFLENSLIFSSFLLISCRFPILKKGKKKEKMSYLDTKISDYIKFIPILREKCPFLSVLSLFSGSRCVFPCVFCIFFLCLKRN